jgi:hypothetical protein
LKFEFFNLKKLITTHYSKDKPSYKIEVYKNGNDNIKTYDNSEVIYDNDNNQKLVIVKTPLKTNGDFRSPECVEMLKECDIVVTNPPFSLFREFVDLLVKYDKKFVILGNNLACGYKEIFPLIRENKIWLGYNANKTMEFKVPEHYEFKNGKYRVDENGYKYLKVQSISWFTNLEIDKRNEDLILYRKYYGNENNYPKYDNYDAINVDKMTDIPCDYYGEMGVPITIFTKYNPNQFEIVRFRKGNDGKDLKVNGKDKFTRIIIKRKQ